MNTIYRVWIAGASGRLGTALCNILDCREMEILSTDIDDVDITLVQDVINFGDLNHPDVIINCAGMTDVAACEAAPEQAYRVNALGARNLAISARKIGAKLVHISTDDVFDGQAQTPYTEFDHAFAATIYGKSKWAGEKFVRELCAKHMIIRSAWVYGKGDNFVSRVLRAAKTESVIPAAIDQFGCPTSAKELANLVICLMDTSEYGLYHGACEGSCSRYEFAKEILRLAGMEATAAPVSSSALIGAPQRPAYTVLDNFMLRITGVYQMPSWKQALTDYFEENKKEGGR